MVALLNEFNHRTEPPERRKLTETPTADAQRDPENAEDAFSGLPEPDSPARGLSRARFRAGQLDRQVQVYQAVYQPLRRENEAARIVEVTTPGPEGRGPL